MSDTASGSHSSQRLPADSASTGSDRAAPKPASGIGPAAMEQATVISSQPPLTRPSQADGLVAARPDRLLPGASLGQFELLEYVGGGGMGHVYRATDKALGRMVALKVLSPEQVADSDTLMRFRNEARSAARLNHENIVQVYHAGEEQGISYIAFEFVEGVNTRQLVEQKGTLSMAEALSYTLQIAEALAYASRHSVVHRDIKPSNVLITPEGRAKLIDMGLARLQGPKDGEDLTASGVTLGTFDYISPEQARDPRSADVRSDIYSLGCTLFFMLAGRPPFPEGTVLQKLLQHQGDEPPDVRQFRPDLPDELSRVLRRMMAKSPQQRYQDPGKLIEALFALVEHVGLQPAGPGQHMWVPSRVSKAAMIQRHLPWAAPVAILIGSVLVLHFVGDWSDRENPGSASPQTASAAKDGKGSPSVAPNLAREAAAAAHAKSPPVQSAAPAPGSSASRIAATATKPPSPAAAAAGVSAPSEEVARQPPAAVAARPGSGAGAQSSRSVAQEWSGGLPGASVSAMAPGAGAFSLPESGRSSAAGSGGRDPSPALASAGPAKVAVAQNRVLVVDGRGEAGGYQTLKAACAAATSGDIIELRYTGRIQPETPITLANLQVTIRAGNGLQPVVTFRPTESDPVKYRRSMFSLIGSGVTLLGVAMELSIPEDLPPDSWTLFDVDQAERLELKRCYLTIRNSAGGWAAYHPDVAFLRLKASPFAESVLGESLEQRRVTVTLEDCVVRGEAVFLRNEGMQPIQLRWDNGMLSTTEWLFSADGSDTARPSYTTQITLDHLTALIGRGLCQFNHTDYLPDEVADIRSSNSILLGSGASVLLEQNRVTDRDKARQRIQWSGDHNFYEGFRIFWSISPRDASATSEQMDFDGWLGHWTLERESHAGRDLVLWKRLPQKNRPVHTHTLADFVLDDKPTNPAMGAAVDRENAGMVLARIPQPPPIPEVFRRGTGSRDDTPASARNN